MVNYPCSILGIALLLYCNLYAAHAYVEPLDVSVDENYILYLRFLMRAKNPPKNRSPYIKVVIDAIDFDRSKESPTESRIGIMLFEEKNRGLVGLTTPGGSKIYCCTDPSTKTCGYDGGYDQIIMAKKPSGDFFRSSFLSSQTSAVEVKAPVHESGIYTVAFSTCNHTKVRLKGSVITMDKNGFLPGYLYMRLPFYATISIAYLVVGTVWTLLCCLHSSEVTFVQKFVSTVMFLGLMHSTMQYMDYKIWNDSNSRSSFLLYLHVVVGSVTITLGYSLLILVCWGYGVVRPSLGMMKYKVLVFSVLFFICNTIKDVFKQASVKSSVEDTSFDNNSSSNATSAVFILFPAAIMNSIAMLWTYNALTSTIENLMEKEQNIKLKHFLRFRSVMIMSFSLVGLFVVFYLYMEGSGTLESNYMVAWMMDSAPDLLYFFVFACISVLWRPAKNSSRYANYTQANTGITNEDFSTEALTDDEDDFGDEEYDRSLGLGDNDDGDGNGGIQMKNIAAKKFENEILVDKVDTRNMSLDEDEV
eukprot:g12956.t1